MKQITYKLSSASIHRWITAVAEVAQAYGIFGWSIANVLVTRVLPLLAVVVYGIVVQTLRSTWRSFTKFNNAKVTSNDFYNHGDDAMESPTINRDSGQEAAAQNLQSVGTNHPVMNKPINDVHGVSADTNTKKLTRVLIPNQKQFVPNKSGTGLSKVLDQNHDYNHSIATSRFKISQNSVIIDQNNIETSNNADSTAINSTSLKYHTNIEESNANRKNGSIITDGFLGPRRLPPSFSQLHRAVRQITAEPS